jgi:hypothetical protein
MGRGSGVCIRYYIESRSNFLVIVIWYEAKNVVGHTGETWRSVVLEEKFEGWVFALYESIVT